MAAASSSRSDPATNLSTQEPAGPVEPEQHEENKPQHHDTACSQPNVADFACSICFDLLAHPVVTPCGHDFCQSCFDQFLDHSSSHRRNVRCPVCRQPLPRQFLFQPLKPSLALERAITHLFPAEAARRQATCDTTGRSSQRQVQSASQPTERWRRPSRWWRGLRVELEVGDVLSVAFFAFYAWATVSTVLEDLHKSRHLRSRHRQTAHRNCPVDAMKHVAGKMLGHLSRLWSGRRRQPLARPAGSRSNAIFSVPQDLAYVAW